MAVDTQTITYSFSPSNAGDGTGYSRLTSDEFTPASSELWYVDTFTLWCDAGGSDATNFEHVVSLWDSTALANVPQNNQDVLYEGRQSISHTIGHDTLGVDTGTLGGYVTETDTLAIVVEDDQTSPATFYGSITLRRVL